MNGAAPAFLKISDLSGKPIADERLGSRRRNGVYRSDRIEMTPKRVPDGAVERLRADSCGPVFEPGDVGYDDARQVWNAMIDHRPDVIVKPTGVADVMTAVQWAGEFDIGLSVKGGGHHISGAAVPDEGLLVDLGRMNTVDVNPDTRIARVQAGATWGEVDHETQAFGLAVPGGQSPTVGVAGLTLGGGVGWLSRKFGLTCDNVRAVELVTADGELIRASETNHPELFWGLRGGGGRFGVVTTFEYHLHEVGPEILAGSLVYPLEDAARIARQYREFMVEAPREVRLLFGLMALPPASHIPEECHGMRGVLLVVSYAGSPSTGRDVLEPLRVTNDPIADSIRPRPYAQFQRVGESEERARSYARSQYLADMSDAAIETILTHGRTVPSAGATVFISPRSGAEVDPASDETAFPHRDAAHHVLVEARWEDPARDDEHVSWVRRFHEALRPHATGDVAMNFLTTDESNERRRAAYGPNRSRLLQLQRQWDPQGRFRMTRPFDPVD